MRKTYRTPSDLFELADRAWSEAEEILNDLASPSELFGELVCWQGSEVGSDLPL